MTLMKYTFAPGFRLACLAVSLGRFEVTAAKTSHQEYYYLTLNVNVFYEVELKILWTIRTNACEYGLDPGVDVREARNMVDPSVHL
jgi:hypothetical protein